MKVAFVRWRDAAHGMSECSVTEMGLVELYEVGFVAKEDEESVTLTMEWLPGGNCDYGRLWLTIPKSNIIEMRVQTFREDGWPKGRRRKAAPQVTQAPVVQ